MSAQEPSRASGTVMLGMIVAQRFRKKTKITITTSAMVSASVNSTSRTEARMVVVRSERMLTWMVGGIEACKLDSSALDRLDRGDDVRAGDLDRRPERRCGLPLLQAAWVESCGPATARPMSRTRTGAPLR